jgi:hypothetical protein
LEFLSPSNDLCHGRKGVCADSLRDGFAAPHIHARCRGMPTADTIEMADMVEIVKTRRSPTGGNAK